MIDPVRFSGASAIDSKNPTGSGVAPPRRIGILRELRSGVALGDLGGELSVAWGEAFFI